jgi:PRTRC genetic system ThiF family protein
MHHLIHPNLVRHTVQVDLIGCGGNGSQMLTGLARLHVALRALGHPGLQVMAWDPDAVSRSNIGRQLFSPADVGANKAEVLVNRINLFYGLDWTAQPARWRKHHVPGIVISCVDTVAARRQIAGSVEGIQHIYYWMDLGNRAQDGQVVLGCPVWDKEHRDHYPERLPTVMELFPELATGRVREDTAPSCSLAEALERQHLFINQAVVTSALQILWTLFRFGGIDWHGAFINLATGRTAPLPVDPETWARMKGNQQ